MLRNLNENSFKAYEKYVLTGEKEEALKGLIAGSDSYNFLTYLDLLKEKGGKLSNEEKEGIEKYYSEFKSQDANEIYLRYMFLKYDECSDEREKKEIIDTINDKYLRQKFDDQRPTHLKKTKEGLEHLPAKVPSKLDEQEVFDLESQFKLIYEKHKNVSQFPIVNLILNTKYKRVYFYF
jgi:hypothetical protein